MGKPKVSAPRVRKHWRTLRYLCGFESPSEIKAVLQSADKELIGTICECIQNLAKGNIPISKQKIKQLRPHQKLVGKILDKSIKFEQKKKHLVQSGGFLPLLLAPLLGVADSLIGDAISSRNR